MCAAHHFTQQDIIWRQRQQPVPGKVTSVKTDSQLPVSGRIWTLDSVSSSALMDLATRLDKEFFIPFLFDLSRQAFINLRQVLINTCRMKTHYSFRNDDFKLWIYELSQTLSQNNGEKKSRKTSKRSKLKSDIWEKRNITQNCTEVLLSRRGMKCTCGPQNEFLLNKLWLTLRALRERQLVLRPRWLSSYGPPWNTYSILIWMC